MTKTIIIGAGFAGIGAARFFTVNSIDATVFEQQKDHEIEVNYKNIRKGSECEVLFGPLKGIRGEVVRISGQSRLLIRLASMGVSLQVNISRDEIKPIKNKQQKTSQNKYPSLNNITYRKTRSMING